MSAQPSTPFDDLDPFAVLTAAEVAERMRVDPRSVRRAVARGDLVASRACGLRILAADAAAWWRARRESATAERLTASRPTDPPARARRFARSSSRLPLPPRPGGAT